MYYGGDYNPEQWPEPVWLEDARLMREAGVNLVSLGIFAWARLEPAEGEYDFAWLDRVMEILHGHDIGIDLATATASPPPWLTMSYPDSRPVTADGVPLSQGSRQHFAATSPDYRRLAVALAGTLGERYATHPAVRMWHVNNEYACAVHADHSDHAVAAFRRWLEARYGTVAALNEAWGTDFWAQRYGSFAEVVTPRRTPSSPNPSAVLDFRRFTSDSYLELYLAERDALRAAGARQPITTNFMGLFPPLDYWRWAQEVDVVADDCYPDPRDPESFRTAALARDLMRSLRPGQPWLLMEQASNAVQWRPNNRAKAPGQLAALSEQAVARGADGILFFQWRQSRAGSEKFHSAMLPHAGTETRTWREVVALGSSLAGRPAPEPVRGQVAIVLDWENSWALDQPNLPGTVDHAAVITDWYLALHRRHVQVSFVRPTDDLAGFAVVVAPALHLLTGAGAANLATWVAGGGTLVTTAYTDLVDEHDRFRDGGFATQLREVLGGHPVDFDGLLPSDGVSVTLGDAGPLPAGVVLEDFVLTTGTVAAIVDGPAVSGSPALVRNVHGDGTSWHLTTFLDAEGNGQVLDLVLPAAGVTPVLPGLPPEVEAIEGRERITVVNQSPQAHTVLLPDGERRLAPYEVVHLVRRAQS